MHTRKFGHHCVQCGITPEGYLPFSNLLCDTSSVNKTYLSNHTLRYLDSGDEFRLPSPELPVNVISNLFLNANREDKRQLAMDKILQHHTIFDVRPFFEWEFKVLPLLIHWFTKAADFTNDFDEQINRMKLSSIYAFIMEFPILYIEGRTKQELERCKALRIQLQREQIQLAANLEEVQRCEARALRRIERRIGVQ